MSMFLTLVSGIGWMIVYEECIRLGFKQKTYCMPLFVLSLNFSWELLNFIGELVFHWHGPSAGLTLIQTLVNGFWAILDIVILYTYCKYGRKEWPKNAKKEWFGPWTALVLICCFTLQIVFIAEFGGIKASEYSAFLQNLLMSVMFISMYIRRGSMEGQSLLLAVAKWLGTLAPTILMGDDLLVLVCGIFCSVFDLLYIWLLLKHKRTLKHDISAGLLFAFRTR